jgi:cytochrome c556
MKATTLLLFGLLTLSPALIAQENATFTQWMTRIAESWSALKKMDAKTGKEAIHHAERMGSTYEDMVGFWRQRNASATEISIEGKAALAMLAGAAYANDAAKAEQAFATVSGTCGSCHSTRRVKLPNGKFGFGSFEDPKKK